MPFRAQDGVLPNDISKVFLQVIILQYANFFAFALLAVYVLPYGWRPYRIRASCTSHSLTGARDSTRNGLLADAVALTETRGLLFRE